MLYVCSPRVASLKELEDRCLHLSDIPQHDVTRDLILFNHQRLAEIELGKQLEQKKEELRNALNDLEAEKQKTDMLLHSMLPRQVADQLREGKKVEAGKVTRWKLFNHETIYTTILSFNSASYSYFSDSVFLHRVVTGGLRHHRPCLGNGDHMNKSVKTVYAET